jgi:hypothetical protein
VLTVEDWAEIRRLHRAEGMPIKAIVRTLGVSRNTVRAALASDGPPKYERKPPGSAVDAVEPRIRELLRAYPTMPGPRLPRPVPRCGADAGPDAGPAQAPGRDRLDHDQPRPPRRRRQGLPGRHPRRVPRARRRRRQRPRFRRHHERAPRPQAPRAVDGCRPRHRRARAEILRHPGCAPTRTPSSTGSACPGAPAPSKATSTASRCSNDKCTDARTPTCSAAASSSPTNPPAALSPRAVTDHR